MDKVDKKLGKNSEDLIGTEFHATLEFIKRNK